MMRFPISDILNEQECYNFLMRVLHPEVCNAPRDIRCLLTRLPTTGIEPRS